jgi:hypothetical protein
MTGIRHDKVYTGADGSDPDQIQPNADWNADHVIDDDSIPAAKIVDGVPPGWLHGSTAPSDGDGVEGQYYLRESNGAVYQKGASTWGSAVFTPSGGGGGGSTDDLTLGDGVSNLVGVAGVASAPPATPEGYFDLGDYVVPYYLKHAPGAVYSSAGTPVWAHAASVTVPKPDDLEEGRLIVLVLAHRFASDLTWPSGFTDMGMGNLSTNDHKIDCAYKVADAGDVAGSGWEVDFSNALCRSVGVALDIQLAGVPVGAAFGAGIASGWGAPALPVLIGTDESGNTGVWSAEAIANFSGVTWTTVCDYGNAGTIAQNLFVAVGDAISPTGATGTFTATDSDGATGVCGLLVPPA